MSEKNSKNNKEADEEQDGFLFSVEVLIKGRSNGHALESLTHLLNGEQVTDYRIVKGINLGQIIAANLDKPKGKNPSKPNTATDHKSTSSTAKKEKNENPSTTVSTKQQQLQPIIQQIEKFKENRSLIRIIINKGKGVSLSIPCRILNFDWNSGNITAYHVDEKKVYSIDLNEIDDIVSS